MLRRNFIGSVIGTFVGSRLPFTAQQAVMKPEVEGMLGKVKQFVRIMELSDHQVHACRVFATLDNGTRIWAPTIKEIIRVYDPELKIVFCAREILMKKTMTVVSVGIVDDLGRLFKESNLSCPMCIKPGEKFYVTYNVACGF